MPGTSGEHLTYLSGFGNEFASEAVQGALPVHQNSPKVCPFGLYAEQLSGTAFTAPRRVNQRSWLYRLRPSVGHDSFEPYATPHDTLTSDFSACTSNPNQLRWLPFEAPGAQHDFVDSLFTICGSGSASSKSGFAIHVYALTAGMDNRSLANADGDFLIVPQAGALSIVTEFGRLAAAPGEICVIQRGMRFAVNPVESKASGYILEVFSGHFQLPELGPIGANGLAAARHFLSPTAAFEDRLSSHTVIHKFDGRLWGAQQDHSPFDVVAWHGNYAPYKYDLANFCPINAAAFDHPDPSIFTVLTCPSSTPGVAVADFVIFPPRWLVAEHTFRPPYFHRNCMSEFMGLIRGAYDGKRGGFLPGGASLHSCMSPHGVDVATFEAATAGSEDPKKIGAEALAFMFETDLVPRITSHALNAANLDKSYQQCWKGFKAAQVPAAADSAQDKSSFQHASEAWDKAVASAQQASQAWDQAAKACAPAASVQNSIKA